MAFGGFVDEFTNSPVQPAFSTYLGLNLVGDILLDWSQFTITAENPFSQLIVVTANTNPLNTIFMPDATLSSVQQTVILGNSSATAFNVSDFAGNPLGTIATGEVWFYALTDNTTQAGLWFRAQFGGTIQPGDAAALVGPGYGLIAEAGLIKLNFKTIPITALDVPYNLTDTGRGRFHLWLAGNDLFNLPLASSVSNGFVFSIANQSGVVGGIANVTPAAADTINGLAIPIEIKKDESTFLIGDGVSNWSTVGRNQVFAQNFAAETTPINAAITTMTAEQANPELQQFTNGSYVGAATVIFPAVVPSFYIMWNNRSAGNNITVNNEGSGLTYLLLPGETLSLYSDGVDLHPIANIFLSADGTAANPAITYGQDTALGFYRVADNTQGFTSNGVQVLQFDPNGLHVTVSPNDHTPTISPIGTPSTGLSFPTTTSFAYSVAGVNVFDVDNTGINFNVPITVPVGSAAMPSYSFFGHIDTGGYYIPGSSSLGFAIGGIEEFFINTTQSGIKSALYATAQLDDTTPSFNFQGALNWGMNYNSLGTKLNLITAGASALQINNTQRVSLTHALAPTSGGTGLSTYAVGDTLYASAIDTLAALAINATPGKALVTNPAGTLPIWGGLSILSITSVPVVASASLANTVFAIVPGMQTPPITPKSVNSKFFVIVTSKFAGDASVANYTQFALWRNGAIILDAGGYTTTIMGIADFTASGTTVMQDVSISYLDSPATVAPVTYSLAALTTPAGTYYFNEDNSGHKGTSTITVVEIGGL